MRRTFGWIVAAGLLLGAASAAQAQVAVSFGTPFSGFGLSVGTPYYGYGYAPYGYSYGYGPYAGTTVYSSGYTGFAAPFGGYVARSYTSYYPVLAVGYYGFRGPFFGYRAGYPVPAVSYGYYGW